jgi:hypothetical protein
MQILDCGVDGLLVRNECCKLVDGPMAELVNVDHRALGHVFLQRPFPRHSRVGANLIRTLGSTGYRRRNLDLEALPAMDESMITRESHQ